MIGHCEIRMLAIGQSEAWFGLISDVTLFWLWRCKTQIREKTNASLWLALDASKHKSWLPCDAIFAVCADQDNLWPKWRQNQSEIRLLYKPAELEVDQTVKDCWKRPDDLYCIIFTGLITVISQLFRVAIVKRHRDTFHLFILHFTIVNWCSSYVVVLYGSWTNQLHKLGLGNRNRWNSCYQKIFNFLGRSISIFYQYKHMRNKQ